MGAEIKITDGMVLLPNEKVVTKLSTDLPVTIDAIWGIDAGDHLESLATMRGKDHPFEVIFTAGKRYQVQEVRPLQTPPVAVVNDDSGRQNNIDAAFLNHFKITKK